MQAKKVLSILSLVVASVACGPEPQQGPAVGEGPQGLKGEQCFWGTTPGGDYVPLTKIIHLLRTDVAVDRVDVTIVFNRDFVDLTYGAHAIGWESRDKGHSFKDLHKSDHTELALLDAGGEVAFRAKIDLLSESPDVPSNFRSLGIDEKDGELIVGDRDAVIGFGTSLDDNINELGYELFEDSPETDASYAPNPEYPGWDFFVTYRLSVRADTFPGGFGSARMEMVHASPSKLGTNSITVEEDDCPVPGTKDDPFCGEHDICDETDGEADKPTGGTGGENGPPLSTLDL